jgi:hypothetical protein
VKNILLYALFDPAHGGIDSAFFLYIGSAASTTIAKKRKEISV